MTTRIVIGDAMAILKRMGSETAQCVVTSPPYYGLRDYETATWHGGDPACAHKVGEFRIGGGMAALGEHYAGGGHKAAIIRPVTAKGECPHCGALRIDDQIGLEASPSDYVAKLVEIFREVRRVLRQDGTLWLNLGDSYAGSWGANGKRVTDSDDPSWHGGQIKNHPKRAASVSEPGLKPKDLMGVPWRVALALRDDGWYLRQDIIWSKPNPMPESVRDRCTKAHEYLFLLSKAEQYYFDHQAFKEPAVGVNAHDLTGPGQPALVPGSGAQRGNRKKPRVSDDRKDLRSNIESRHRSSIEGGQSLQAAPDGKRNRRTVWTVATQPSGIPHFAQFPPKLIEPCILAGCPSGGLVLDPFIGAGTTALVAENLGRSCVGIELNPDYAAYAVQRVNAAHPGVALALRPASAAAAA